MLNFLKKLDAIVAAILKAFVVGCCVLIAVILMMRVIMRFTPINVSLSWTDEIVEWSMAYMIFFTSALIMRNSDHFKVDLLQERFKGTLFIRILNFLIALFNLAFFVVLLYYSWDLFIKAQAPTIILRAPRQLPYASILIGVALIVVYCIRDVVVMGQRMIKGEPPEAPEKAD